MACLDSRFRVRGVDGLRVVDASKFPPVPGSFPMLPIYIISEKATDVILEDIVLEDDVLVDGVLLEDDEATRVEEELPDHGYANGEGRKRKRVGESNGSGERRSKRGSRY
jgi:choline dehydrogenase-like flavoprotein